MFPLSPSLFPSFLTVLSSNFGNGTWENSKFLLCCGWPPEKNSLGHGKMGLFCEVLLHWHWESLLCRNHKHFNFTMITLSKSKILAVLLSAKKKISSAAGSNFFSFLLSAASKCTLRLLDWSGSDGLGYSGGDDQGFFSSDPEYPRRMFFFVSSRTQK